MNLQEYSKNAARTCPDLGTDFDNQLHMVLGISTEANELLDVYKKYFAYDKPIDYINVREEIFDVMWYIVNLCRMLDVDMEKDFQINIDKLRVRYPEKFTNHNAINRNLEKEREQLEK